MGEEKLTLLGLLKKRNNEMKNSGAEERVLELIGKIEKEDLKKNLNEVDKNGNTALHYAVLKGYTKAVKVLLEKGANIEAENWQGETALNLANDLLLNEKNDIITLFEEYENKKLKNLSEASKAIEKHCFLPYPAPSSPKNVF